MSIKWEELVKKHLVGRKIVDVKWLSPKQSRILLGWDQQPCEIFLDDGTILTPSRDDEGNNAGAIITTIEELPCIPTFRN